MLVNQFLHQATTKDERDNIFDRKLYLLRLLNLSEIAPETSTILNISRLKIRFQTSHLLVEDGDLRKREIISLIQLIRLRSSCSLVFSKRAIL